MAAGRAAATGPSFRYIPIDDAGELQLDVLDELAAAGNVKVVATGLVSNSLGTINPVERLAAWAHEQGAIMVVDAAQAAPHRAIDVQALGCDFLAFSVHKLCGPSGVGALWGASRAARGDVAVQPRRRDDPVGRLRATRPGTSFRTSSRPARPRSPRPSGSARAIDYVRGDRPRRDRARTSTSSPNTRSSGSPSCVA